MDSLALSVVYIHVKVELNRRRDKMFIDGIMPNQMRMYNCYCLRYRGRHGYGMIVKEVSDLKITYF